MTKLEDTPEGRIAIAIDAINRAFEKRYAVSAYRPSRPNAEDYRQGIELRVKREILMARILQEASRIFPDSRLGDLRDELKAVEIEIAANPI